MRRRTDRPHVWPAIADLMAGILLTVVIVLSALVYASSDEDTVPALIKEVLILKERAKELETVNVALTADLAKSKESLEKCTADLEEFSGVPRRVGNELAERLTAKGIKAGVDKFGNLEVSSDLLYEFGDDAITDRFAPDAEALGRAIAELLAKDDVSRSIAMVLVIGHTDSVGHWRRNMGLSNRRAASLVQLWGETVLNLGEDENMSRRCDLPKILSAGFGESRPKVWPETRATCNNKGSEEQGCAANRRIEIRIVPKQASTTELRECP